MVSSRLPFAGRRVAIVHDWLTGMRGGEWVLDVVCELLPDATLFTLVHIPGRLGPRIERMRIKTSFVDRLPGAHRMHQRYLPLFPRALEQFDFSDFDFIFSTSHCVAKGAAASPPARHVCYCHTPMRYVWKFFDSYFNNKETGLLTRAVMPGVARYLRRWDKNTADRVDRYLANSRNVAGRIRSIYGRSSEVLYPPVDIARFRSDRPRENFFLIVSALVPYKQVEIAVEAFRKLDRELVIVGRGPERIHLERIAGPKTRFIGWANDEEVARLYSTARALLFPGEEDFGIVPLEAQASGCPVIALRVGGALETVVSPDPTDPDRQPTGVFFDEPSVEHLIDAVRRLEKIEFSTEALRRHASRFDRPIFRDRLKQILFSEERRLVGE